MSRVELSERIRREHRDEGVGIRALAERHRVHRRTVRQALASAVPPPRRPPERQAPALGAHEATVRAFVARVKAELAGQAKGVTIGQEHAPGEEAEVDFGEFQAFIDGALLRLWLFVMRLSCSGRGFATAFAHQAQEAFEPAEAKRLADRLELHYTPKHGSWLNMAEIELSVLSEQCLDRRLADRLTLEREVAAWQAARNATGRGVDWR